MNYPAMASLMGGMGIDGSIPIGADWHRVKFALAGFGYVVPGTITTATSGILTHSTQATAVITHSVTGN